MFQPDSVLLIHGRVFDGTGEDVIDDGGVWVEGDEIRRVGRAAEFGDVPGDVPRVDVRGRFVMPGLVEPHAHLSYFNAKSLQDLDLNCSAESTTIKALLNARTMLRCGYTSALSFGSLHAVDMAIRDHINQGLIPGPRYLACGRDIVGTGGMIDWNPDYLKLGMDGLALLADNPWEVRQQVRKIRKAGGDTVKLYLDGEAMTESDLPGELSYTQEEADAVIDEAHRRSLRVVCHARSADAVKQALRAGVDIVGHANYLDDEALAMLREHRHRIHVTPAVYWQVGLYENGAESGFSPDLLDGMGYKREVEETVTSVRRMHEAGIKVLPGGDVGLAWTPHGTYARDLQNFIDLFGYTPSEVLLAATRDAGELIDAGGRVGTLEAGKFADLVVVDGDPLTDITVLQDTSKIAAVMKGGEFFHDTLPHAPSDTPLASTPGVPDGDGGTVGALRPQGPPRQLHET